MEERIIFFYYYSSKSFPANCFLDLNPDIAYRNMFLERCPGNRIHFEFPMFEDHSYNSICNGNDLISLFRQPSSCDKYILFRTKNKDTGKLNILGYYKIGCAYYQETNLFDRKGFVWGFKADEIHLVKKGEFEYTDSDPGMGKPRSWSGNAKWKNILEKNIRGVKNYENVANLYQLETNRLISLFKNKEKIDEWREYCLSCKKKKVCNFHNRNQRYKPENPNNDLYYLLYYLYSNNHYSRNVLEGIQKISMRK